MMRSEPDKCVSEVTMNREPRTATLTKAIDVLTALLAGPRSLAVICKKTDLPKPTVHRLLDGLTYQNLVIQVDDDGTYALGPGCLRLAEAATKDGGGLAGVAWPVLEQLWTDTEETVTLHVRVATQRVCITELISMGTLRYVSGVGSSAPLTVGSAGKVLLAFLAPSEQRDVLDRLRLDPVAAQSIPEPEALRTELAKVRRQGWARSFGERVLGAGAFSSPVFAGSGRLLAALSVLGPAERFGPDREAFLRDACLAAAAKISERMGTKLGSSDAP
jgi:DNA-binding IclR family transcriptional regulator